MTDKARELLYRALSDMTIYNDLGHSDGLMEEISAYLAQPEVKQKRLSGKEIEEEYWDHIEWTSWTSFLAGVRFAEKHHGIGDNNENTNT